jgi:hypothetical protein
VTPDAVPDVTGVVTAFFAVVGPLVALAIGVWLVKGATRW